MKLLLFGQFVCVCVFSLQNGFTSDAGGGVFPHRSLSCKQTVLDITGAEKVIPKTTEGRRTNPWKEPQMMEGAMAQGLLRQSAGAEGGTGRALHQRNCRRCRQTSRTLIMRYRARTDGFWKSNEQQSKSENVLGFWRAMFQKLLSKKQNLR